MYKQVEGYENYIIHDDGRLWSNNVKRYLVPFGIGRKDKNGIREYRAYKLCSSGVEKTIQAHRLVAKSFIPNPENLPEVNHINGIKWDNRVENLEWCDHSRNTQHAFDIGLNNGENWEGELHSRSTYTNKQVENICLAFSQGVLPRDMAPSTSKEYQKLFRIWNRDNWKHISNKYVW